MNKQKLVDLFKNPSDIDAKHLEEIEEIVKENPYFHSAYALIAVGKKRIDPENASKDLIKAAIYATNRINLKKYLEAGQGGSEATTEKDTVVEPPIEEKKVVQKETTVDEPAKDQKIVEKPKVTKPIDDDKPKTPAKIEEPQAIEEPPVKEVTTVTRPTDIDLEKIVNALKSEYKQLEVNMKNFDQAEKSLRALEIQEASETKSSSKKSTAKTTSAKKKTVSTKKPATANKKTSTTKKSTRTTSKKTGTSLESAIAKKPAAKASVFKTKTGTKKKRTSSSPGDDSPTDSSESKKKSKKN